MTHTDFDATLPGLFLKKVHSDKHGSDTGTYDHEGRFLPQKFEDIFAKYAEGRDYLTIWDVSNVLKGQRCIADPIGWGGAFFECKPNYYRCLECVTDEPRGCHVYYALARGRPDDERRHQRHIRR